MTGPAPVDDAAIVPATAEPTRRTRARATARRWAVRLDETSLSVLWARLLELEFIDRSVALAAKLFVSFFPMLVVVAAVSPALVREQMLEAMGSRFGINGPARDLVRQAFAAPDATKAATGFFGILLTICFSISFTTALQRVYLRAWRRPPGGGVRNKARGVLWVGAVLLFFVVIATTRALFGATLGTTAAWLVSLLAGIGLWWWTAWLMVRGEIRWRPLFPTAVITATGCWLYSMQSDLWMPTTVQSNFGQFGAFGVALSLVTFFTGIGFIVVVGAAVGPVLAERDDRVGTWLRSGRPTELVPGAQAALAGPGRRVKLADAFGRGNKGWGIPGAPIAGSQSQQGAGNDDL